MPNAFDDLPDVAPVSGSDPFGDLPDIQLETTPPPAPPTTGLGYSPRRRGFEIPDLVPSPEVSAAIMAPRNLVAPEEITRVPEPSIRHIPTIEEQTWEGLSATDKLLASDLASLPRDFYSTLGTTAKGIAVKGESMADEQARRILQMFKAHGGPKTEDEKVAYNQAVDRLGRSVVQRMEAARTNIAGRAGAKLEAKSEAYPVIKPDSVSRPLGTVAGGVGNIAASLAPAPLLGPGGVVAIGSLTEFGDAYESEIQRQKDANEPLDIDKAMGKADIYAAGAMPLEYIGGVGRLARRWFGAVAEKEVKELAKKGGAEAVNRFFTERLKDSFAEGGTELLQQLYQDAIVHGKPNIANAVKSFASAAGGTLVIGAGVQGSKSLANRVGGETEQQKISRAVGEAFGAQVEGSSLDESVLDATARDNLTPPAFPLATGETLETGPQTARIVSPQATDGRTLPQLPEPEAPIPSFNVTQGAPYLKNSIGQLFVSSDGFKGRLRRDEAGRFVLDDGNRLLELPVNDDATASDAGVALLYRPQSALQRSREAAKARPKTKPVAAPYVETPGPTAPTLASLIQEMSGEPETTSSDEQLGVINHQLEQDGMPVLNPEHEPVVKAMVRLIGKLDRKKEFTNEDILRAQENTPATRRIVNGYIQRLQDAGAPPDVVEFYQALSQRMDQIEELYLEGITRPDAKNKGADVTQPPAPSPVPPASGALQTGGAAPPVAPVTPVTTPVTIRPQGQLPVVAEPQAPRKPPAEEAADAKRFKQLFADWGVRLGFIRDPELFFTPEEKGGDSATIAFRIRRAKAIKQAYDSVIKYLGGDPSNKTHAHFSQLLPKLEKEIAEFNQPDNLEVPDDVNTDFLPPEAPAPQSDKQTRINEILTEIKEDNVSGFQSPKRIRLYQELGSLAVPGIRLGDAEDAGRLYELVQLGEAKQAEFDKWVADAKKSGRVSSPEVPKLRPGEKKTGDLFQGADQPFNLATEVGVDQERVAREKAEAERKAAEAEEARKKAQMNLPVLDEPAPKGPTPQPPVVPNNNPPPAADEQLPTTPPKDAPTNPQPEPPGKLFTDDESESLKAKLKAKLNKLKGGGATGGGNVQASAPGEKLGAPVRKQKLDSEVFNLAVQVGADYIQRGYHKFEDFQKQMLSDFGPVIADHLKAIYETARITIEAPTGAGVRGRSPGLQPGLRPPAERIITARAALTPKADESVIPPELRKHLDEHQRQGAAAAILSMNDVGGFLNADGTGAGKSRQALAVAHYFATLGSAQSINEANNARLAAVKVAEANPTKENFDKVKAAQERLLEAERGKPRRVVIISINSAFKPNWSNGKFGGSYKADAEAMGVKLKLAREGFVHPGEIGITTYDNLAAINSNANADTVYLFDEAHALKNDSKRSQQAAAILSKARNAMFLTATPGDKPEHIYYLAPIGIMEGKSPEQQLKDLGMKIRTREVMVKTKDGYEKQRIVSWGRDSKISDAERQKRLDELFGRMTQQGHMIKREISMEGVNIRVLNLALPQEAHDLQQEIVDFFVEGWGKESEAEFNAMQRAIVRGHMRRQQEPFKVASATMLAKRELDAGRQVVIYVARVNESEVGINKTLSMGDMGIKTRDVLMSSEGTAKSLRNSLHELGIHDIAEIHGNSDQTSLDAMADFQSGKKRVVIATVESGGTGINLDDTVGNRPRTEIMMTAPFGATENVQAIGRIWRLKTLSEANVYYLFGDTFIDRRNASIVAQKMRLLGAVVSGQVSKMNVGSSTDVAQEHWDDFMEEPMPKAERKEVPPLPEMEFLPRTFGKGIVKYVASVPDESHPFWDWWYANGTTKNPFGLTIAPVKGGGFLVWSNKPIIDGMPQGFRQPEPMDDDEGSDIEGSVEGARLGEESLPMPSAPTIPAPSPVTAKTLTPKSQRQIITDLAKALGVPTRFGRLGRMAGGFFVPHSNLIRLKDADDVVVMAHEIGHKIDDKFGIRTNPKLTAELEKLGDPASFPGSRSSWNPKSKNRGTQHYKLGEGFAEFIRYWFTNPAFAKREAPNIYAEWESILASNRDLEKLLTKAQSDIQTWLKSPAAARFRSQVSRGDDPLEQSYTVSQLTRDVVDDLHILRLATEDAKKGMGSQKMPASWNPYLLARNLRGSGGMAETFIRNGTVNFGSKEVTLGTSLEDALKPVRAAGHSMADFGDWLLAKRAKELERQGVETGFLPADVDAVYRANANNPVFNKAFDDIQKWQDALLQYAVDSGLIEQSAAQDMRKMHKDYVPFHRVFEVGAGEPAAIQSGTGKGLNVARPSSLRGLHGSTRQVVDPLESMVKNAYAMINASEKAAINTALANLAQLPGMGKWIWKLPYPQEKMTVELDKIRSQLIKLGADLTNVQANALLTFWKGASHTPAGKNTIRIRRGDKSEFYEMNKDLFETFNALDLDDAGKLMRFISAPAQWLRAGVVLEPGFALANVLRDQFGSAVVSKYGLFPFEAIIKGIGAMINNPKLVSEWAASGGKSSIEANFFDRTKMQKYISEKITKDLTRAERALVWAKSPLLALRWLTGVAEDATRIGEYKVIHDKLISQGMPEGEARRLAAFESRDRQDFAKGGAKTKILRHLTPFWNATLQGNVKLGQAFKERKFRTVLQGVAFITIPKLMEQALNWEDEDYWARPQWERDAFFMIPIGKSESGHTRFLRLPVPFLPGVIFATFPGRMLQAMREKDPGAMKDFPQMILKETVPNPVPPALMTALEVAAGEQGWDFFRNREVVSDRVAKLPLTEQFTDQTTEVAKRIGKVTGISPMKVDHVIEKSFGGMGRVLTGEQAPGKRFISTPLEVSNRATDEFFKFLEREEEKHALAKRKNPESEPHPALQTLHEFERSMNELRSAARQAKSDAEKLKNQKQLLKVTTQAVEWYKRTQK